MRWSRIKNIIILLLVMVNGFLLAQVSLRDWQSQRGERETRERMRTILARNDVTYLPEEIPGDLELSPRRVTLEVPGRAQAAILVGEAEPVEQVGARVSYEGEGGQVTVSASGELEARFQGEAPLGNQLGRLLEELGVEAWETDRSAAGEKVTVTLTQRWKGIPVPGLTVEAVLGTGGRLESLALRRLAGEEELLPAEETITASTALTRLLEELSRGEGYVCSQILRMYPGYVHSGAGTVTLTPAWFIETDTWRFAVDGVTGSVSVWE